MLITAADTPTTAIELVATTAFDAWLAALPAAATSWIERAQFKAKPGQVAWLPDAAGAPARVVAGWNGKSDLATLGHLPMALPEGTYEVTTPVTQLQLLGWGLGSYSFNRYKSAEREPARLVVPAGHNAERLANLTAATQLVRDLINVPAGDLLPSALAEAAIQLADANGAEVEVITGDALLERNFNTIHAVGRASLDAPRLIDITWGQTDHPLVVLVGKGVCFDSGGLDIKPANNMRWMKKDMGGAAHVLGLAQLIMAERLPVRLRVLIPAVENAIAGNAYRPGDILTTYKGTTVEIDNTDAEGRLVLCDALALAVEQQPELVIDYATLTGAARSAVGTEIAAMFCNDDEVALGVASAGTSDDDPVWRMPLHQPYEYMLDSKVADVVNSPGSPYGGAITAALFLKKFVGDVPWLHFDIMAFNTRARPGRPEGGEAMGMRAVFGYLLARYAE